MSAQTISCLVNNYNYAGYIREAVDSALAQTTPVDEVVVVDDGSSDGSVKLLERLYASDPRVRIVSKSNGGQLSCFQEGFARSTGDLVFFLDANDIWEPEYVSSALEVYRTRPAADFIFSGLRRFGDEEETVLPWPEDRDLGYSAVATSYRPRWVGAPTSALSMRRWVVESIFPVPFLEDWRTRADRAYHHR